MSVFTHIPLGQRIPASLHGVSASLPTMRDVIGYEEKDPEVTQHMTSGYPRFVVHPFAKKAGAHLLRTLGLAGNAIWLTSSIRAAEQLRIHLGEPAALLPTTAALTGVTFPEDATLSSRAKTFLQHSGMFLSSREAEDYLLRVGELTADQAQVEKGFDGYAPANVKGHVARFYQHASASDVFLATSGMNALAASFRVAADLQRPLGRTRWLQLGWLYLDTIAILQKFTDTPAEDYLYQSNVFDLAALKQLFIEQGSRIAGLITEVPTNPLIQTPDLAAIAALCREYGVLLIIDPTVASPLNIDVLPHADLVANSLTKYTAGEGDVILGAVVVNPQGSFAAEFRTRLPHALEPVYSRDIARLASQIGDAPALMAQINRTTPAVVEFLRTHPRIKELYWSLHPDSRENYLKIARSPDAIGSMISFVVDMPVAKFYDRLRLPKGPSFGMKNTLICPFIYLAHYDLVTSEDGRATLAASGLHPELLRLSIGSEPAEDIIATLAEALAD
ncbi:PLP-dependent transferase [Rariglobus hedericola]|uniref:PLP-dependent transferase n=1 Tax=Rariglobus hedericola TaxID=2597822 RepID=A0A556QIX3_9BACT|nr:PLP-dependent transferase [Rariglobus hedericola]TSJ76579.1 PLP-dependent transferase [Rariglobus hedericola]